MKAIRKDISIKPLDMISIVLILISVIMAVIAVVQSHESQYKDRGEINQVEAEFTITQYTSGKSNESITSDESDFKAHLQSMNSSSYTTSELPFTLPGKRGDIISCTFCFPAESGTNLVFRGSHQKIRVFLNGKEVDQFGYEGERYVGSTPGSKWMTIPLPHNETAEVEIFFETIYEQYKDTIPTIYVGTPEEISHYLKRQLPYVLIEVGSVMAGIFVFFIAVFLRFRSDFGKRVIFASLSVISISLWLILENRSVQYLINNPSLVVSAVFIVFPMMPIYVCGFLRSFEILSRSRLIKISTAISCVNFMMVQCLQSLGIVDYVNSDLATFLVDMLVVICLLYSVIINKKKNRDLNPLFYIFCSAFAILGMVDGILYFNDKSSNYNLLGFSQVGFSLFVVILTVWTIQTALQENQRNMKRELYKKVAYTDLMTELSNRSAYEEVMEKYREKGEHPIIAVIDINNLKIINDKYGHKAGDDAIMRVASILRDRQDDYTQSFRIGGDEFCIFRSDNNVQKMCTLLAEIQDRVTAMASEVSYPLNIAYGLSDGQGSSVDEEFNQADTRMYEDKNRKHAMETL